ncbi:MAG: molecular chaperone HtpG [Chlamydiales bacterium]
MVQGKLEIHSENILPIIKKWLYSEKDIFVRELVSNACDAIQKVKFLSDQGEAVLGEEEFAIHISINKEKKNLVFSDNGIGMTSDEVKKYIAQIAFSGAEAFVEKYKTHEDDEQFIGHFGLGFYSAYMVADQVDIDTLSYQEGAQPAFWSCDGSSDYKLDQGGRQERGTTITLHVSNENEEYLEESRLSSILRTYCGFLPIPIFLNGKRINEKEPLWIKSPTECSKEDYLAFYRHLYPFQPDPLFWIHLNVDYPFHLKGVLYFPKLQRNFDLNKSGVSLYCNRVFVSDNCKDLIPNYLMPLQGIIDSPDIPLNVSRSYLQTDKTVRQLSSHISKKVSDSLSTLFKTDREHFLRCWEDVSMIIKLGAVEDEKFYERVKDFLVWKTNEGEWMTAQHYNEVYGDKTKQKILYTSDAKHQTQLLEMYKNKGLAVIIAGATIDSYVIHHIERHIAPATFQRIDSALDDILIDTEREKSVLDAEGKTEATHIADLFRKRLNQEKVDVVAKSLNSDDLPAFILIEESQRRFRDYMQSIEPGKTSEDLIQKRTFVVNTNNPLIDSIRQLDKTDPELSQELVEEVYALALLSQREMSQDQLNAFIMRTNRILQRLSNKAQNLIGSSQ